MEAFEASMKKAFPPNVIKTALLDSSTGKITKNLEQMKRWVEHCEHLYSRENVVAESAIEVILRVPVIKEIVKFLQWKISAQQSTLFQMTKPREVMKSKQKFCNASNRPTSTNSSAST